VETAGDKETEGGVETTGVKMGEVTSPPL